jgi:hypothetical protein
LSTNLYKMETVLEEGRGGDDNEDGNMWICKCRMGKARVSSIHDINFTFAFSIHL